MSEKPHPFIIRNRLPGGFSIMLCSIVLTFALRPFLESYLRIALITDIFFSIVLISGIYTAAYRKSTLVVSLLVGIPALILDWTTYFSDALILQRLSTILFAVFFCFALAVSLAHVLRQKKVTPNVIMGAACAYFLMGISWAFIFFFLEQSHAGSFVSAGAGLKNLNEFLYFSFITLTTTGYGDITPVSNPARSLAVLEAAIGQLYIAVTVARLVGIYTSQTQHKSDE